MTTPHRTATVLAALIGLTTFGCASSEEAISDTAADTAISDTAADVVAVDALEGVTADVRRDPG